VKGRLSARALCSFAPSQNLRAIRERSPLRLTRVQSPAGSALSPGRDPLVCSGGFIAAAAFSPAA